MNKTKEKFRLRVGMRNIKTAVSATLCAIVYLFIDRNPTFACIGAIFGMGSDMENSWLNGGNRLFGTIIGGFVGMILFRLYLIFEPSGEVTLLMMPFLFVGVVVMIIACQFFRWPGGIQPGGVILSIILFTQNDAAAYIPYSLNRMLDTAVGVIVALLVNLVFSKERTDRVFSVIKGRRGE